VTITRDEARAILARWQPILRLADWDIDLRLVTTPWRKSGDVKVDLDDRKAVLLLRAGQAPEHLEEVVVHELIHLRLYAMDQMLVNLLDAVFGAAADDPKREFAETQFMTLLESTTEDLAKALLAASGSTAPLTFERLRDEVEQEIGPHASAG
jgi:restriction endonuclease Mrr